MRRIEQEFASAKPSYRAPSIDDIASIGTRGPWKTKSGGELNVLFAMPMHTVNDFLRYETDELKNYLPRDLRGLRQYHVKNLNIGKVGIGEFHRLRKEMIFVLEGLIDFEFEDVYGGLERMRLDPGRGVYIPNFILHSYDIKNCSQLVVLANTLFDPDDPVTHDTYSSETFRKLQHQYLKRNSLTTS
ncbi:WxcM-like domain-containing protein [Candidatus Woesearchaeota archaeon]|nr:WxcM-like domain-containing protein [Candidatus Woesearchaeota archaeon]